MTPAIDREIRDFETVAASAFFAEEDLYRYKGVAIRAEPLKSLMIRLAQRSWSRGDTRGALATKLARKAFFLMNPALTDSGASLVDGHTAGIAKEKIDL